MTGLFIWFICSPIKKILRKKHKIKFINSRYSIYFIVNGWLTFNTVYYNCNFAHCLVLWRTYDLHNRQVKKIRNVKFPNAIPLHWIPNIRNTFEDIARENIYVGCNDYYTFTIRTDGPSLIIKHALYNCMCFTLVIIVGNIFDDIGHIAQK